MLKLKYLFDNRDLAEMILKNWNYDTEETTDLLKYFRISSNAVYPFKRDGAVNFLRFTPQEEGSEEGILAEIDYINFLKGKGYPVVEVIPSKVGKSLEIVDTPWGRYFAVAFKGVPGKQISRLELTEDMIYGWGKALGQLHGHSVEFKTADDIRVDWRQKLIWMEEELKECPQEASARKEVELLGNFLSKLPVTKENFGLIHYDFEADNLFYEEATGRYYPIDFDDSVYHWFVMDIVQAIDSVTEDMPSERHETAKEIFLRGYRSVKIIDDEILKHSEAFRRYANLYGYIRCLRSIGESWSNEPDWMVSLRQHFKKSMERESQNFGKIL
ncbi:phosphotransferase enzyme family protein [Alkaliphilus serpentinus]|uniref:phosphotransferase enzyme family protein n=1 Tax=Alkaliphilus serpentinus TaxID=1482731 RepID=UPI0018656D6D|nr:phosphotransferase [Alkaliphilus serpentinus]